MEKLFLDDLRNPPDDTWTVVRSYDEFVDYIDEYGLPNIISFDHDLGKGKTGYDCVKWLVENEYKISCDYIIHSANPIGRKNIEALLENWIKFTSK